MLGSPDGLQERIIKQDWIGQARQFAESRSQQRISGGIASTKSQASDQTYEAFAVELMIGPEREVIHTRVMQVSSGDEEIWGGWQEKRLTDFFLKRADLRLAPVEAVTAKPEPPSLPASLPTEKIDDGQPASDPKLTQPKAKVLANEATSSATNEIVSVASVSDRLEKEDVKADQLNKLEIIGQNAAPTRILQHGQPFQARLSLNLTDLLLLGTDTFAYTVTLIAQHLGGEKISQTLGYKKGELNLNQSSVLEMKNLILPLGSYRVDATVTINKPAATCCGMQLKVPGGLLQVY